MVDVGNKLIGQFADRLAGKLAGVDEPAAEPVAAAPDSAEPPDAGAAVSTAGESAASAEEVEPIDLMASAGPAVLKRLALAVLLARAAVRDRHPSAAARVRRHRNREHWPLGTSSVRDQRGEALRQREGRRHVVVDVAVFTQFGLIRAVAVRSSPRARPADGQIRRELLQHLRVGDAEPASTPASRSVTRVSVV